MTDEFEQAAARYVDRPLSESAQRRHLAAFERLTRDRRSGRQRRFLAVSCAAIFLSGAGLVTAASLGAFSSPVGNRNTAHCYTTADLGNPDNHNAFGVAASAESSTAVGDAAGQALDYCRGQWAMGRFTTATPTFPDYASGPAAHPVPPLVACVLDNGEVAVFPGARQTCRELGLANAQL